VSARAQQRRETAGRERQQERQPEGAGDARGDGVADDALAAGLPRPAQVDGGAGRCLAKCGGPQEGDRGGGAAAGGGPVATLHRADHRRKTGADLPAGSVLNPAHEIETEEDET